MPSVPQTPLWLMLLETGARFGEAVQVTWGDLSESQGTITLRARTTKSRKERRIPIRVVLIAALQELRLVQHRIRGRLPSAGDLVFLTSQGRCASPKNLIQR